jgi:hypothetical protein
MSTEEYLDRAASLRLDEMSSVEFRDVTRRLSPDATENEIELAWLEFLLLKHTALYAGSGFLWQ